MYRDYVKSPFQRSSVINLIVVTFMSDFPLTLLALAATSNITQLGVVWMRTGCVPDRGFVNFSF